MSKLNTDYTSELHAAVKLFIDQPLKNSLTRSQIMDIARIALPVLEQQQWGEGEWIEWGGGGCPVDSQIVVEYKTRLGNIHSNMAYDLRWIHEGKGGDIIAYRQQLVKPKRGGGF